VFTVALLVSCSTPAGTDGDARDVDGVVLGTTLTREGASDGLTLIAPEQSTWSYLVDAAGNELHRWPSTAEPGQATYLLESGLLLRAEEVHVDGAFEGANGRGGVVKAIDWDGEVVWQFEYHGRRHQLHHDIEALPNGHVLMIAWEHRSKGQALAVGRDPDLLTTGQLWPDHIIEVEPATGAIVWEWHVWDHLVQDRDPTKPSYGAPEDHPRRIDVNFTKGDRGHADWNHTNSVDYDAQRDEIVLSVRQFSEIWVIDHGISTRAARGPAGDLLFRWGNPAAYGRGRTSDQELFVQHDARWTREPSGAVAFSVFNNGLPRVREHSTVDVIVPTMHDGRYVIGDDGRFAASTYQVFPQAPEHVFFASNTSGAQRLGNGNVLVTDAPHGRVLEVTPGGSVLWEYVNPYFVGDPSRVPKTSAGLPVAPWRLFKAEHYARSYPGLGALRARSQARG
jgi:hypothetical protein